MIFPKGTEGRQKKMIPAQSGAAMQAMRTGVTALPIAHVGTRRILRTFRSMWFPRVTIQIGEPFTPDISANLPRKAALQHITEEIMFHIAEMLPAEHRGIYAHLEGLPP